jgi:hypothetical protein
MLLRIDHLVIAVRDPDAAASELEAVAGIAWTGGGRHESMGTFNRLAFLGDSYLELIGVFDPDRVAANPGFAVGEAALAMLNAGREGFATYALATDDIDAEVTRLRTRGSRIGRPVAGARSRPDGEVVRWTTAFPALGPEGAPFLIEHVPVGSEWGEGARSVRAAFRHPVGGALRLAGIDLPVADPAGAMGTQARDVGLRFDETWAAQVDGQHVRLRAADGEPPIVDIVAEPGAPVLDVVRFGVRWRRRAAATLPRSGRANHPSRTGDRRS